jgi:hypothetical protein
LVDLRNNHDKLDWVNSTVDNHFDGLDDIVHSVSSVSLTSVLKTKLDWGAIRGDSFSNGDELGNIDDDVKGLSLLEIFDDLLDEGISLRKL